MMRPDCADRVDTASSNPRREASGVNYVDWARSPDPRRLHHRTNVRTSVRVASNWLGTVLVNNVRAAHTGLRVWNPPVSRVLQDARHPRREVLPLRSVPCPSVIREPI
uniref:Uncharacterized protein n=1 Tax=Cacopsylla melanoneura TaxID=428564 RepID=A0A8D8RKT7_9HEMI